MKVFLEIRHKEDVSTEWTKRVYEDIYGSKAIRHIDSFYAWILKALSIQPGACLLDISCGVGSLVGLAARAGTRAYGVDFSETAIRIACKKVAQGYFVVADGERLPYPDNCFDYVTSIGSLEHYLHPEKGVREIARVLKPEGRCCILLPNTFSLLGNIWVAFRTGKTFDDGQPIQRYAARFEWQDLLETNGLKVIKTLKYERAWPRSLEDLKWYLSHPKDIARLFLGPFVPLNLANYFVFICKPSRSKR